MDKRLNHLFNIKANLYLWVIFLLVVVIAVLDWRVAVPGSVLMIFVVYHYFSSSYKRQKEIVKYIENLNLNINTATKDTLLNFPMPLVLVQLDGTVIWYNSSFKKVFKDKNLLDIKIQEIVPDIDLGIYLNSSKNTGQSVSSHVALMEKSYNVLGNFIKIEDKDDYENYSVLLYFIDVTELTMVKKIYEQEKTIVGTIIIDNYDELMQSIEDSARPQMLAEIEKKIAQWMNFTSGILKKYERDKYIFIFQNKYLKELEDKKFEILDSIKEINIGNKIPVTLSIGLGMNGETLLDNFSASLACIDIALGRGGDQVVIKNGDKFSFYGGKTRELEKRTRVKARVIAYALRELMDQSSKVLIMGHQNADIDALGAALGLYRIAVSRQKQAYIVLNKSNPTIDNLVGKILKNENYQALFLNHQEALEVIDDKSLIIVVDTFKPGFTELPKLLEKAGQIVVIDHHRKGTDFIQDAVLIYQEIYASSTCELVTEILQYVDDKLKLTSIEAEALYAGIVVDTKNFTFKTGVRTFDAAAFLRKQGADTVSVKQLFQNDFMTYNNVSDVVRSAEFYRDNMAISLCPSSVKNAQLICAKAADELLNLSGITAAFVIGQVQNEVIISGRSYGDVNVQVILEKLGGGGHMTVAGAQLQGIGIEEAKHKLKKAIEEYMNENSKQS